MLLILLSHKFQFFSVALLNAFQTQNLVINLAVKLTLVYMNISCTPTGMKHRKSFNWHAAILLNRWQPILSLAICFKLKIATMETS